MAVTANQKVTRQGRSGGRRHYPVAASTRIYGGTLVFLNANGYADDDTNSGANKFAGVAVEESDNSSGANGDENAEVYSDGVVELTGSGFSQGNVGDLVYASDNYTVTTTSTSNTLIGRIEEFISSTKVGVSLKTDE